MKSLFHLTSALAVGTLTLGLSVATAGAATLNIGGPNTSIGLGTSDLQPIVLTSNGSVTTTYFFNSSVSGVLTANSGVQTSAGTTALNPFSIELDNLTTSSLVEFNGTPVAVAGNEFVGLSGDPIIAGDNYELVVIAQAANASATNHIGITGNVTLFSATATPLPGALSLFAGGLGVIGLLSRRKKRSAVAG